MGMALDEPGENDEIIEDNGITYLVEKDLFEKAKPINIDVIDSAKGSEFSITSSLSHGANHSPPQCAIDDSPLS
jgi:Fe-S cluster assembly iron-binding protein IscA